MKAALCAALGLAAGGVARAEVAPLDLRPFEQRAASVFSPASLTGEGAQLLATCDQLLLITQAIAATIIVAGLLSRLRKEDEPFDGIATMMVKVAFIATVPFWRMFTLETADAIADAVGYKSIAAGDTSSVVSRTWELLAEWVPPGSPYLDALDAQTSTATPGSGEEPGWGLRAWNWARGVGAANEGQFQWLWQSFSGGLRATLVFVCCAGTVCAVSLALVLTYFSELVRVLLFHVGCALGPIFIAGLGVTALRASSTRFLLGVAAIAFWPVGWALANIVSQAVLQGALTWMRDVAAAALRDGPGLDAAPVSVAAPYLGWGTLLLFASLTLGLCLWLAGTVFLVPVLFGRAVSAGTLAVSGVATRSLARVSTELAPRTSPTDPPLARPPPGPVAGGSAPATARPLSSEHRPPTVPPLDRPPVYRGRDGFPIMGFSGPSSDAPVSRREELNNFKSPGTR